MHQSVKFPVSAASGVQTYHGPLVSTTNFDFCLFVIFLGGIFLYLIERIERPGKYNLMLEGNHD